MREDGDMLEGTDCTSYEGVIFTSSEVFAGDKSVGVDNADVVELGRARSLSALTARPM